MKEAIYHENRFNYCYPLSADTLRVRLRTRKQDVEKVEIFYQNIYDHDPKTKKSQVMELVCQDSLFDYYETSIHVSEGYFKYYFSLLVDTVIFYSQDGFIHEISEKNYFYYPEAHQNDVFSAPEWAQGAMIYQILIDRFANKNRDNDPANVSPWDRLPDNDTRYGGDFQGIIGKLDYIKSLGMDAIYLSPFHLSPSYHKYDITDYMQVESCYGGLRQLKKLIKSAHETGLRIIVDGVFNHCSSKHPLFADLLANQEKSKYRNWFKVHGFPVSESMANYDSFGNLVPAMPKFNTENAEVIKYLTDIAVYWTKTLGIDGWRLDVGDELTHKFLRTFREKVKEINPEILIIGETWNVASSFMQNDQFDTITNYKNRELLLKLVNQDISVRDFIFGINQIRVQYKSVSWPFLLNLVGSHDTIRLATGFQEDGKWLIAFAVALFLEGGFILYYGDETKMEGAEDPDNRRPMNWNLHVDNRILDILHIRQQTGFSRGSIKMETTEQGCLRIIRELDDNKFILVGNLEKKTVSMKCNGQSILFASREDAKTAMRCFDFIILKQ